MGKYEPLRAFLQAQQRDAVPMTFADIERILSEKLPPSKRNRAWWSNNPENNVMTREWLEAGYRTEAVDIRAEKLVFRRIQPAFGQERKAATSDGEGIEKHPGFGFMRGLIRIEEGFDVTKPFAEPWGEGYLGVERDA